MVKNVDLCFPEHKMSPSNLLFYPQPKKYSVYFQRRAEKVEYIHIKKLE